MLVGHCFALVAIGLTVSPQPGRNTVTAEVGFSAVIVNPAQLAIDSHDLGHGLTATVATYRHGSRTETIEAFSFDGDSLTFDATGERMVAVRSNLHGLRPTEQYARR